MYIIQFIRGFCMALADSVPGVSGGTVAFLLGFYDRFIDSIDDLVSGTKEERKAAVFFLIKLGVGWVTGMVLAMLVLASVFESHIYAISSLFIGFIIFAIPVVAKEEKETLIAKKSASLFVLVGIVIVCAITMFNPAGGGDGVNLEHLTLGLGVFVFVAGMIAISAMVLPGISGSTLLLIMGLYLPIVTAIKDILHLELAAFPTVFLFGCGVLVGAVSVVKVIRKALEDFRAQTIYLIIGLMLGSIYAVVKGPETLEVPQPAMTFGTFNFLFFLIGGAVIFGMQLLKGKKEA